MIYFVEMTTHDRLSGKMGKPDYTLVRADDPHKAFKWVITEYRRRVANHVLVIINRVSPVGKIKLG